MNSWTVYMAAKLWELVLAQLHAELLLLPAALARDAEQQEEIVRGMQQAIDRVDQALAAAVDEIVDGADPSDLVKQQRQATAAAVVARMAQ
jgi:hypothetical protein